MIDFAARLIVSVLAEQIARARSAARAALESARTKSERLIAGSARWLCRARPGKAEDKENKRKEIIKRRSAHELSSEATLLVFLFAHLYIASSARALSGRDRALEKSEREKEMAADKLTKDEEESERSSTAKEMERIERAREREIRFCLRLLDLLLCYYVMRDWPRWASRHRLL